MKLARLMLSASVAVAALATPAFAGDNNPNGGIIIHRDGTVEGGTRPLRPDEKATLCALAPQDYDFCTPPPSPPPPPPKVGAKPVGKLTLNAVQNRVSNVR